MTERDDTKPASDAGNAFEPIWEVMEAHVRSGRLPGYVGAVRINGRQEVRAGGRVAVDPSSAPMGENTLFRIASVTKPIGGALALSLVEDGAIALDDPIARWVPEATGARVLVAPDAPLDRTTELQRPITIRHLLTMTSGWGAILEDTPLRRAMIDRELFPGALAPPMSGDEFVARLARLPLAFHPGDGWLYDTSMNVLGVVLARAAGKPLSEIVAERVTGPLGMTSTGFWARDVDRLATAYRPGPDGLDLFDPPDGAFARPPAFEALSSGLVSTAGDLLGFFSAMADGGSPVLSPESLALMTADALTDEQRTQAEPVVDAGGSWGLGTGVDVEAAEPWMSPGRWGWDGGTGTSARVDPRRGTVGVILTQRLMTGPLDGFGDFWTAVAATAPAATA